MNASDTSFMHNESEGHSQGAIHWGQHFLTQSSLDFPAPGMLFLPCYPLH